MSTDTEQLPDTDVRSHHIEGYLPGNKYMKVPLISHVEDNLWVGGCIPGVKLPAEFKHVVSLYKWGQYVLPEGCDRHEVTMYDSHDEPDEAQLKELADLVNKCLEDGQTLVHCQAGINRSNLVTAFALMQKGRTADEAIALLRAKRHYLVLANQVFENWLRAHEHSED